MLIFQGFANSRIVREFPPVPFKKLKRSQTTQLTSNLIVHKNPGIEIQAKFNLSMVP